MENKKKIIIIIISAVVALDLILAGFLIFFNASSQLKLQTVGVQSVSVLKKLSYKPSVPSVQKYTCYKFSYEQKAQIEEFYKKNGTAALTLRIRVNPSKKQKEGMLLSASIPFSYGFILREDLAANSNKVSADLSEKIAVTGNLSDERLSVFDVEIALSKAVLGNFVSPEGFFTASAIDYIIEIACITPAEIGFDFTGDIPYFGFASNGGQLSADGKAADFSGAGTVFPVENTKTGIMPQIVVTLLSEEEYKSTVDKSVRAKINFGGEQIFIKNVRNVNKLTIPAAALKNPFSLAGITDNSPLITSLIMKSTEIKGMVPEEGDNEFLQTSTEVFYPVKTDPGLILQWKPQNWRVYAYEIFEWDRFPGILFFDTRNYDIQDNFFRRIAYFVEKAGYKGTLVSDEELAGKHGYNAHDYRAESLAAFFDKAAKEHFPLLPEEITLQKILIANGLIIPDGQGFKSGTGAIVSISQSSEDWKRVNLLAHEGWHTIFFTDEEFRNYVSAIYYTMDQKSLEFLLDYFRSQPSLGYDTNDEYLMHNEFMAYLMQQRLSDVKKYYISRAGWGTVMKFTPELAEYIRQTEARGLEDAAVMLNDFCFDHYGVVAGSIALVQR